MENFNKFYFLASIFTVIAMTISVASLVFASQEPFRKIIVFQPWAVNEEAKDEIIARTGGVKIKNLDLIGAKVAYLPNKAAEKVLAERTEILRIDDDVEVFALENGGSRILSFLKSFGKPTPFQPAQTLPWGIDRIDAEKVWAITAANPIKVGIIDTGIELSHPDLAANIKGGYNAVNPAKSANDDNGHGTHVAGIVGALNNTIGVVGAGPEIDLYAIKVLNRNGSGFLSDVIEGIDWAISNGMQVINMSLGASSDIQSFHDAVIRARQAGIVQVAAAGNNYGGAVVFPAAYPEVIAVSAVDLSDNIAYFSSVGPEVDLAAPGVSIYSAYKGSTYKYLSGTSMASPHVAGAAALLLSVPAKCDSDGDGVCSTTEIQARLETTAIDLGSAGKDDIFGSGLVNVYNALTW